MAKTDTIDWPLALKNHEGWLKKVLRCRITDRHSVEDVLQDIAVAVLKQLNQEPPAGSDDRDLRRGSTLPTDPEKVAAWLYRVAVRQAVNVQRKRDRQSEPKTVSDIEVESRQSEPLQWMLDNEIDQNLKCAMNKLTDAQREILMLKFTENWSYRKLAAHLGISQRAVEHRLLKARQQLRSHLQPIGQSVSEGASHGSK